MFQFIIKKLYCVILLLYSNDNIMRNTQELKSKMSGHYGNLWGNIYLIIINAKKRKQILK